MTVATRTGGRRSVRQMRSTGGEPDGPTNLTVTGVARRASPSRGETETMRGRGGWVSSRTPVGLVTARPWSLRTTRR